MRARCRETWVTALALVLGAPRAGAQVPFPSVVDRVVGLRLDGSRAIVLESDPNARVEFGDIELFGMPGLRLSGARATAHLGGLPVGVEASRLGAPVGSHTRMTARVGVDAPRWRTALRAGLESLALEGTPGESAFVTGVASGVDAGGVSLLADVESIAYKNHRATFMTVALAGRLAPRATVVASVRYEDPGSLATGVAVILLVHASLSLIAGYDDGTATARAGVLVGAGRWTLAAGAFRHAVLGMSQGVSVSVAW